MKSNSSGFTLMEIVVTTIIVGVIASFAFSNYTIVIERHRAKEAEQILQAIFANIQRVKVESGSIGSVIVSGTDPFLNQIRSTDNFSPVVFSFAMGGVPPLTYTISRQPPGPGYTLSMTVLNTTTTPVITCSGGPAGLCAQLGY